jgi:hypothetical protein
VGGAGEHGGEEAPDANAAGTAAEESGEADTMRNPRRRGCGVARFAIRVLWLRAL